MGDLMYDKAILVRSDLGDGGWSIYPAGTTDDQIAKGEATAIACGDGALMSYKTAETIRIATDEEIFQSLEAAELDGGVGAIATESGTAYVT
ncbi:MAG: hypothetical protein NVS2B17_34460 [Candidatus Velthaea sp.]